MGEVVSIHTAGLQPGVLRLANRIGKARELSFDKLLRSARSTARYDDLGTDWWDEPLRQLILAINQEARLSYIGALIMKQRLKGALVTRLRAVQLFKEHGEILAQEVAPIRLITGLQRTGTTYLQRLLSVPADARPLLSWETLDPVPRKGRTEQSARIRSARLSEKALAWMSPGFFAIHPIDHLRPEEDVLLLDHTFMTTAPEAIMHVPSYAEWLEEQDHSYAYQWESKMLKLLQWQRPATHWVLKSPHHLEHLRVIKSVFPQIKIIWMHRPPEECVASFLSMVYHGRAMFSDRVDPSEVGSHWLRKNVYMVKCAMEQVEQLGQDVIHTDFEQLVRQPVELIERLYREFGVSSGLTAEDLSALQAEIHSHKRDRFGVHMYDLGDYGLTSADVGRAFQSYIAAFNSNE